MRIYELQEAGSGAYFLDSVSADIDSLLILAGIHPIRRDHYRFLAERFPFWIYYRVDGETAYVAGQLVGGQITARTALTWSTKPSLVRLLKTSYLNHLTGR